MVIDAFADDKAIVGGIALLEGQPVTVIGVQKGHTIEENVKRSFGSPNPEGYRKQLRLMKQAEKFNRPVVLFCKYFWCLLWYWCRRTRTR